MENTKEGRVPADTLEKSQDPAIDHDKENASIFKNPLKPGPTSTKQVKKITLSQDFYFTVFSRLKAGESPSLIAHDLGLTKQRLNYYIASLKREGFIQKIGYGTWKILKEIEVKQVKKITQYPIHNVEKVFTCLKPNQVRGHAFIFTFKLPSNLPNWNRREELLTSAGIEFKKLSNLGEGQQIIFRGRKFHLKDSSIILYEKASFIGDTAQDSKSYAIYEALALIKGLEAFLHADFKVTGSYHFKVSRSHYSLIKNALARQYDREGRKLLCYNNNGLWFTIDNSYNLLEAETMGQKSDVNNKKVQDFFNGVEKLEGFTPQFVTNSLGSLAQDTGTYRQEIRTHIKAIQDLGQGVTSFVEEIKKLKELLKNVRV